MCSANMFGTRPNPKPAASTNGAPVVDGSDASAPGDAVAAPPIVTSRICVKNLPSYVNEKRLRDVFTAFGGEITDIKLMKTADGKFRRFAFIGFVSTAHASTAIDKLNNTYVDTNKIVVEPAQPPKSDGLARPWSRYSEGSSAHTAREAAADAKAKAKAEATAASAATAAAGKTAAAPTKPSKSGDKPSIRELMADPNYQRWKEVMAPGKTDQKFWGNDDSLMMNESGAGKV